MKKIWPTLLLVVALAPWGCRSSVTLRHRVPAPAAQVQVADRLFFGCAIPAGGTVSDADWDQFVRTVITPRFPEGLTISRGNGQWLDKRGELVREAVFIVEVFHEKSEEVDESIATIAEEYKKRFGQDAVLRVTSGSVIRFY